MWPMLSGLITGGASLLGNIFSSNTSAQNTAQNIQAQQAAQRETESFNAGEAQKNRDFQAAQVSQQQQFSEQMSNSAYQRASADMKSAGLNPAMMFGSGSAASSPQGSAASGSTASVGTPNMAFANRKSALADLGENASKVVSTAVAAKTFEKMTDEIAQLRASTARTEAETRTEEKRPESVEAGTMESQHRTAKLANEMPAFRLSGITAQDIIDMKPELRRALVQAGFIADKADKVTDAVSGVVSSALGVKNLFRGKTRSGSRTDEYGNTSTFEERFH